MTLRGVTPFDEPKFPEEYDFGFVQIGEGTYPAKIQGDTIKIEYANASATYHIVGPLRQPNGTHGEDGFTERPEQGFHAELDEASVTFFDAPAVTEEGIAAYQALHVNDEAESDTQASASIARAGTPYIDDKSNEPTSGGKG